MKKLVSDIHNAVQNSRKTVEFLKKNSSWTWYGEYPVAVVHEINRVEDRESLESLEKIDFFDSEGFSKKSYTKDELKYLAQNVPSAIKSTYCICLKRSQTGNYTFQEKFQHDRWKKVRDEDNFVAFVENSKFDDEDDSKVIETELRDIMRSAKEIPSLKDIGFAWIVTVPKNTYIEDILKHYFLDNHIYVEKGRKVTYIAWGEKLADINMRYFVNTP